MDMRRRKEALIDQGDEFLGRAHIPIIVIPRGYGMFSKYKLILFSKSVINLMSIYFATSDKLDAAVLHCNSDTDYSELVHTPCVKYVCVSVCACCSAC